MLNQSDIGKGVNDMAARKPITPTALAKELNVDPKRLRAYLRSNHARPAEAKNTSWTITTPVAAKARAYFRKAK